MAVIKRPGQHLGLTEVVPLPCLIAKRIERITEVHTDVDGQLGCFSRLGKVAERVQRLLEVDDGLAIGRSLHGPESRLTEIGDGLLPHFTS